LSVIKVILTINNFLRTVALASWTVAALPLVTHQHSIATFKIMLGFWILLIIKTNEMHYCSILFGTEL